LVVHELICDEWKVDDAKELDRVQNPDIIGTRCYRVLIRYLHLTLNYIKEILMKIRPLHDRIVVKRVEEETKTAGGIVLPGSAAEKPSEGEVLAVGSGKPLDNGQVRALEVKVGDKVLFGKYSGTEVKVDGEQYIVMREEDIMGILG
jgi:chaperonin GroES